VTTSSDTRPAGTTPRPDPAGTRSRAETLREALLRAAERSGDPADKEWVRRLVGGDQPASSPAAA
jgi:hypothetical protein